MLCQAAGFTPPVPHIGELWPGDTELVRQNQANFGKLWHRTRAHFEAQWKVHQDQRGCELYLQPKGSGLVSQVYISPIAQGGSLLRVRVTVGESALEEARRRLDQVAGALPVTPEVTAGQRRDASWFVDLLAPLRLILGDVADVTEHETRLLEQVVPAVDALVADA